MRKLSKKWLFVPLALLLVLAMGLPALASGTAPDSEPDPTPIVEEISTGSDTETELEEDAPPVGPDIEAPMDEDESLPTAPEEPAPIQDAAPSEDTAAAENSESADIAKEITPASYGQPLDATSILVSTYAELKRALGEDNGYTTVYLGADIADEAGGLPTHANKSSITIDGSPPSGGRYTFTQYQATNANPLIQAGGATTRVTLRAMDIVGKNTFGLVSAPASTVITLEDVTYTGPQALYHRGGTVRFIGGGYTLTSGELAEALHAEFGGRVTIDGPATGSNALLWLTGTASTLRVLAGADVTISTKNYFVYGAIASATLEAHSSLRMTNKWMGFSYALDSVGTFTLAEGAGLYIALNTTESYAALRVSRRFEMAPGSSATILRTGTAGIPLRLTAANAQAVFDRPGRVFLYSSAGVPLRFTGAGSLSITTSALNVWAKTAWPLAEGMDALPSHIWNKAQNGLLALTGSYSETQNQGLTHNLTGDDPTDSELTAKTFNLEGSQLIAFGAEALTLDPLTSESPALGGTAAPGARLLAAYTPADGQGGKIGGDAGADGRYSLPFAGGAPQAGTAAEVIARASDLFLRQRQQVLDASRHTLSFVSVPGAIQFGSLDVPGQPGLAAPLEDTLRLTVRDSRLSPTPWRIDLSLSHPLAASVGGTRRYLPGSVLFKTGDGETLPLNELPRTVYRSAGGTGGDIELEWTGGAGLLLDTPPGEVYTGAAYTTTLHWTLVDAP